MAHKKSTIVRTTAELKDALVRGSVVRFRGNALNDDMIKGAVMALEWLRTDARNHIEIVPTPFIPQLPEAGLTEDSSSE